VTARVVAVVGPTATGKSAVAIALAHRLGGEVVNVDSMQLYRGMDVGTAKLTLAEREGVTHHLLDIWPVTRTASVADYQRLGRACIEDLLARGVSPILVGGSGLYVRALLDPIEFPGTEPEVRAALENDVQALGSPALHARLAASDPAAAAAIDPANGRKIIRALEVIALTGKPFSAALPGYDSSVYDAVQIGLDLPTEDLDARIATRVERMVDGGLVDEVRALARQGLRDGVTASRALGYAQMLAVIDGAMDVDTAVAQTVQGTRRFLRRQRSWFRRDPRITWFDSDDGVVDRAIARVTA